MYSVALSIAAGMLVGLLVGIRYSIYAAIFTGFFMMLLAFFFLMRTMMARFQTIQVQTQKHLEQQKFDQAIQVLQDGMKYQRWMLFGAEQIKGQIGTILYIKREFDNAFPYLKESFTRNWMAQVMLGAIYFRKKQFADMEKVMAIAVRHNKNVPLLWGAWAFFDEERENRDQAIEHLRLGLDANPEDEALKNNLLNLQNKKKLKMEKFGDLWYALHFETPRVHRMAHPYQNFSAFRRR